MYICTMHIKLSLSSHQGYCLAGLRWQRTLNKLLRYSLGETVVGEISALMNRDRPAIQYAFNHEIKPPLPPILHMYYQVTCAVYTDVPDFFLSTMTPLSGGARPKNNAVSEVRSVKSSPAA